MTRSSTSRTSCGACASHGEAGDPRSTARIILDASLEVRAPIVYATLIVVIAVVPVLFMEGLTGSFFKPLIAAYVLAIAGLARRGDDA